MTPAGPRGLPLATPGLAAPGTVAPPHTSLLGGFTLLKREVPKGRSRIAAARGRADAAAPDAVLITTQVCSLTC